MTCKHRRTPNSCRKPKNKETTDEQVRGKPEDQAAAAECACCPTCPQPMYIGRQEGGGPDTKETTDEQVREKPEDQPAAAEDKCCPRCLQLICICRQRCERPGSMEKCKSQKGEHSCITCKHIGAPVDTKCSENNTPEVMPAP